MLKEIESFRDYLNTHIGKYYATESDWNGEKGWNPLKNTVFAGDQELYNWMDTGSTIFCAVAVPGYGAITESGNLLKGAATAAKVGGVMTVSMAGGNAVEKLVTDLTGSEGDGAIAGILAGAGIAGIVVKGFGGKASEVSGVKNDLFWYDNPESKVYGWHIL